MREQGRSNAEELIRRRVEELLGQMTLAEKSGQLTQYFSFGAEVDRAGAPGSPQTPGEVPDALARGGVGSLLFVTDPAETNRLQRLAVSGHRLGIPALFGFDVVHGLRTVLPVPIGLAASWDPAVVERGQAVAAREARAVGIHWTFAPMVDIARDPRWGRIVEGAGEDPFLGGAMAAAQVRGFQGEQLGTPDRIVAGPKHFAGYGAALGGRDYDEVDLSEAQLRNTYLPPFKAAVDAGAGNIMTAYMPLNGVPATADHWLLQDVLRSEWGFTGFVVSDANAVRNLHTHGFARDLTDAGARAVAAGVDLEMAITHPAYGHLPEAVESGAVSIEAVDACVRRVLEVKLRLGLFDQPYVDEDRAREVLADPSHRDVARVAAQRSAVLLRNEPVDGRPLLPLDASAVRSVAVVGPLADSARDTLGPWVFDVDLAETVTVLQGLRDRLGDVDVRYAPGVRPARRTFPSMFDMFPGNTPEDPEGFDDDAELERAVGLAESADLAVVVIGEWQHMIGEAASRSSLELPGRQLELLQAGGSALAAGVPDVEDGGHVLRGPPQVQWTPVQDQQHDGLPGGHVADLLLGDAVPGGKLPFSWPRTVGQVPMIYSRTTSHEPENAERRYWDEASTPLFPFGHGLSYATFDHADLCLDRTSVDVEDVVTVRVRVTNTSTVDGDEVVQLYLHQRHGRAARPVRELKGFQRVHVPAGTSRTVQFRIGPQERLRRSTFPFCQGQCGRG